MSQALPCLIFSRADIKHILARVSAGKALHTQTRHLNFIVRAYLLGRALSQRHLCHLLPDVVDADGLPQMRLVFGQLRGERRRTGRKAGYSDGSYGLDGAESSPKTNFGLSCMYLCNLFVCSAHHPHYIVPNGKVHKSHYMGLSSTQ